MSSNDHGHDLADARTVFAQQFLAAISAKSVEDFSRLFATVDDYKQMQNTRLGMLARSHRKAVEKQAQDFFTRRGDFIDACAARPDRALGMENVAAVVDADLPAGEIETLTMMGFAAPFTITMQERLVDDQLAQPKFVVRFAYLVDGRLKLHFDDPLSMQTGLRPNITPENTPFARVEDRKALLHETLGDYAHREDVGFLIRNWDEWYLHDGDITLDTFDQKVNLVVTGDLTINEPVTTFRHHVIVLGTLTVNALYFEDANVVLLGSVHFKIGVFTRYSSGPFQVLNNPVGPVLISDSETLEVSSTDHIGCVDACEIEPKGNIGDMLRRKFLRFDEDNQQWYLDRMTPLLDAIRAGDDIFVS